MATRSRPTRWKVLIAALRRRDAIRISQGSRTTTRSNCDELKRHWPFGKFPLLLDDGEAVIETTLHHRTSAGASSRAEPLDPGRRAWPPRPLPRPLLRPLRHGQHADRRSTTRSGPKAAGRLWREAGAMSAAHRLRLARGEPAGEPWAAGDSFTLADCAAAPSLFYADWVEEIGDDRPRLKAYRARLLAHPVVARVVEEAGPTAPISRSARPTATRRKPATFRSS